MSEAKHPCEQDLNYCDSCGNLATCHSYGDTASHPVSYACDDCCGHDRTDGILCCAFLDQAEGVRALDDGKEKKS